MNKKLDEKRQIQDCLFVNLTLYHEHFSFISVLNASLFIINILNVVCIIHVGYDINKVSAYLARTS